MIYSSDLDSVLSMFKRNTVIDYEFYFACLDKIDMLITEKDCSVSKE